MIQDIAPKRLNNEYKTADPQEAGRCFIFRDREVLVRTEDGQMTLPTYGSISKSIEKTVYLFRIDEQEYYLVWPKDGFLPEGYAFENLHTVRHYGPKDVLFAV